MSQADHPITISPSSSRVVVHAGGRKIADSTDALILAESTYPAVLYLPRKDVDMSLLVPTEHSTRCPFKGAASYFGIKLGDVEIDNCVWTYESPFDAVAAIKDHLAFYPNRVDSIEELPA
jgi:uncharacterized protein (DUF427 family)